MSKNELNWTFIDMLAAKIAEYKIIKRVWLKPIQSTDTIKYNDKTIYTDTVQLELKLGDKKGRKACTEVGLVV